MRRLEIIAKGEVQRVGFRDSVQRAARRLGISGTVQNLEPYDVKIVAEGQVDSLEKFIQVLRKQKPPIFVQDLEIQWAEATGEFQYFRIIRGEWQEELAERFDAAIVLLHQSVDLTEQNLMVSRENLSISKLMLDKQDKMLDKQDKMLEKQDKMLEKQDKMLEKQDTSIGLLECIKDDTSTIREDVGHVRYVLTGNDDEESLIEKVDCLTQDVGEIKIAIDKVKARVDAE
jgi:acylphosphatase